MLVSKLSMKVEFCRRVLISDRVFFKIYLQGLLKLNFAEELCSLDVFRKQVMFDGGLFEASWLFTYTLFIGNFFSLNLIYTPEDIWVFCQKMPYTFIFRILFYLS